MGTWLIRLRHHICWAAQQLTDLANKPPVLTGYVHAAPDRPYC